MRRSDREMNGPHEATSPDGDLEAAEKLIMRWDSAAAEDAGVRMLFGGGGDRADAEQYIRAVDQICRSLKEFTVASESPRKSAGTIQIAMARLEDEFRNILLTRVNCVETESILANHNCPSMSSSMTGDEPVDGGDGGSSRGSHHNYTEDDDGGGGGGGTPSYRSTASIKEIDLMPPEAVYDLRSIAERMILAGYGRECVQVYGSVRKPAVDLSLRQLGVEKLSIGDVQRLAWDVLETKIRRWIRAARVCVRIVFASERRLCEQIFEDLGVGGSAADDAPFTETVKGAAIQLFSFAEAISIGRRSPEKLFKILDLHDALSDLLPDVAAVFLRSSKSSSESIHTQATEILSRLAEAVRGILSEFENAVHHYPSQVPVPGGTLHPLTRYVMNYISLISDYKPTLAELIVSKPAASMSPQQLGASGGDDDVAGSTEVDFPEPLEDESPLASHLIWIIAILQANLESKARVYKDTALSHLFLMNNVHYIVNKAKGSPELRELIGDDYLKRLTGKYRQSATGYQRATWVRVLHCLRDEGIHVSGSFSAGVSKHTLRERFKSFNAAFDEAHRTQSTWSVPDSQLREELRISISELLLPAYRSFLGRFRHHIESGRHPELYIKYSVEDLEISLSDFFEGSPPSLLGRKRSH